MSDLDIKWGNDQGDAAVILPPAPAPGTGAPQHRAWLDVYWKHLNDCILNRSMTRLTKASLHNSVEQWVAYLESQRADYPRAEDLQAFLDGLEHRSTESRYIMLSALRTFYGWLRTTGIDLDPTTTIAMNWPNYQGQQRYGADLETVQRLVDAIAPHRFIDVRNRAILWLLAAGADTISLHRANVEDLDLWKRTLSATMRGTSKRRVTLPLIPASISDLRALLDYQPQQPGTPLFTRAKRKSGAQEDPGRQNRLSMLSMRLAVMKILEHTGIVQRDAAGKLLEPHTYGTGFLRRSIFLQDDRVPDDLFTRKRAARRTLGRMVAWEAPIMTPPVGSPRHPRAGSVGSPPPTPSPGRP